ncbi:MAG: hypothetical protein QOJ37_4275 [Pseudonocardiales bacterium]|nr:hypothetical protein [Pseudonocardiales bacterium]
MTTGTPDRYAEEQAALRRVAALVAGGAAPEAVFAAVTAEVGRVLAADLTVMDRYNPEGGVTVVGAWAGPGAPMSVPVGIRLETGGRDLHTLVFETRGPARIDDYADATGPAAEIARELGIRSAVGTPINVEGRLWGFMSAVSAREEPLPADTEARLAGFTELVATAIANAQARLELRTFAEEQAALRRVATLVARAAPPKEVFAAVTAEVGLVLDVDFSVMGRYDADGAATILGIWTRTGEPVPVPVDRVELGGENVTTRVFETGEAARIDNYVGAFGAAANVGHGWGIRSMVGVPISVDDRIWGFVIAASSHEEPLPPGTEARLAGFTELVATALANSQARVELRGFAEEQAALRRVATLVAQGAPSEAVFSAVAAETGRVLSADFIGINRYDAGGTITVVGLWSSTGAPAPVSVGDRLNLGGRNVTMMVFQTSRTARIDDYGEVSGTVADVARSWGFRSSVGVPISVEGRLWGVMSAGSTRERSLPADAEARLAGFTELVATAIANTEAQAALTASRARIVAAADTTRRRIERDLHDGAQQRLVSLTLQLREVQASMPPEADEQTGELDDLATGLTGVLDELREIARGLHPAALAEGGLRPALKTLSRRCPVPVRLHVGIPGRLPEPIEIAAYYVIAEALTNTAKHASATVIDVQVDADATELRVRVRDDGHGGADPARGSGLIGLTDRVEALGGRIALHSPPGAGTTMHVALPLTAPGGPTSSVAGTGADPSAGHEPPALAREG